MKKGSYLLLLALASFMLVACRSIASPRKVNKSHVSIGILQYMEHDSLTAARRGFEAQLKAAGYTKGDKLSLHYQNAQGDQANLQTISEQLVKQNDLILAIATPAAQALTTVSSDRPIVFTAVTDPISAGLVDKIKKPGGLITGTSDQAPIAKQIDLLAQTLPEAKTIGILYTASERNAEVQVKEAETLLTKAGYRIIKKGISTSNDVQDAAASLMRAVDALFVPTDNTVASTMTILGDLSLANKVPIIGGSTDMVDAGGLLTYGIDYESLGRQAGEMAIKILRGQDPASLAVEYPKTVKLHINQAMADKLAIDTSTLSVD